MGEELKVEESKLEKKSESSEQREELKSEKKSESSEQREKSTISLLWIVMLCLGVIIVGMGVELRSSEISKSSISWLWIEILCLGVMVAGFAFCKERMIQIVAVAVAVVGIIVSGLAGYNLTNVLT